MVISWPVTRILTDELYFKDSFREFNPNVNANLGKRKKFFSLWFSKTPNFLKMDKFAVFA